MSHRISQLPSRALRVAAAAYSSVTRPKVSWLDLQGSGLSAVERLCLEEALLRHDPLERSWGIVGTHDPNHPTTRLRLNDICDIATNTNLNTNNNCIIIMGIGGKPEKLLNLDKVRDDGVMVIKRFSGGGTVVVDQNSLWTTFIGRTHHFPHVDPFPRKIMEWSANDIFTPAFSSLRTEVMNRGGKYSLGARVDINNTVGGDNIPDFCLRENDYVLGKHKMGGNAQAIVRGAWLHHTSFLWDYVNENMQYLTLPDKRPSYRKDRAHGDFLVKLKSYYGESIAVEEGKKAFFDHVRAASAGTFDLEEVTLKEALDIVDSELGGMQNWFDGKCRTRLLKI